ncbi:hypothetical protein AB9E19_33895, partial [Rhizobium leguminosarum]|uniref:hypothetical protein n=1 Tax=Rhizobium leguminosarum TaxID=384 RepID=UPI003F957E80
GEFAVRGGILDIFPPGDAQPVRLDFIGDTIESLRTYDPATQRSVSPIDQLTIIPVKEVLSLYDPSVEGDDDDWDEDSGPAERGSG